MTPILRVLSDEKPYSRRELHGATSNWMGLTEDQTSITYASGVPKVENRIGWAMSALTQAGAVDDSTDSDTTPEDRISGAIDELHGAAADDLLVRLQEGTPDFFEEAVVKLLLAMDYGGAEQRGVKVSGTADGGIDGFVDQDPLGLERVYVQAKRYSTGNSIGRETLQAFIAALHGRGAHQGRIHHHQPFHQERPRVCEESPHPRSPHRRRAPHLTDDQVSRRGSGGAYLRSGHGGRGLLRVTPE